MTDELHKLKRRLATERWRRHRAERRETTWRYVLDHAPQYKAQRNWARSWAVGLVVGQLLFWLYKAIAQ